MDLDLSQPSEDELRHRARPGGHETLAIPEVVVQVAPRSFEPIARGAEIEPQLVCRAMCTRFDVVDPFLGARVLRAHLADAGAFEHPDVAVCVARQVRDHMAARPPRERARSGYLLVGQPVDRGEQSLMSCFAGLECLAGAHALQIRRRHHEAQACEPDQKNPHFPATTTEEEAVPIDFSLSFVRSAACGRRAASLAGELDARFAPAFAAWD